MNSSTSGDDLEKKKCLTGDVQERDKDVTASERTNASSAVGRSTAVTKYGAKQFTYTLVEEFGATTYTLLSQSG